MDEIVDPVDGTRWRVDLDFLSSSWTCIWGRGCAGILDEPSAELNQGCCSVGAEMLDDDEARWVSALGLTLDPERFQYAADAAADGVLDGPSSDSETVGTRVVDGACIFLNRPGFEGGEGCALHLAAEHEGERPIDWKPSVCWQLPLKIDEVEEGVRSLRRWRRSDWGHGGQTMAWCCTEGGELPTYQNSTHQTGSPESSGATRIANAFVGDQPAAETLAEELEALVGPEVAVEIRRRVSANNQVSGGHVLDGPVSDGYVSADEISAEQVGGDV